MQPRNDLETHRLIPGSRTRTPRKLREAREQDADAVAVVSRDEAWPLQAALLMRHLDPDAPIVATIFRSDAPRGSAV
jgi:hypothetical protein